jgi:hypothetical protein
MRKNCNCENWRDVLGSEGNGGEVGLLAALKSVLEDNASIKKALRESEIHTSLPGHKESQDGCLQVFGGTAIEIVGK